MAEEKKEVKEKEIKDVKDIKDDKKKPDQKEKEVIKKKHDELTKINKEQYSDENIVDQKIIEREIQTSGGRIKIKTIRRTTYKNGVVKNKLMGIKKV